MQSPVLEMLFPFLIHVVTKRNSVCMWSDLSIRKGRSLVYPHSQGQSEPDLSGSINTVCCGLQKRVTKWIKVHRRPHKCCVFVCLRLPCVCIPPLDLEKWGVPGWSWSATRGGSSAAYRHSASSCCTSRRRVSTYEDAHSHSPGRTTGRSRRKRSLDRRTDSLRPVPES